MSSGDYIRKAFSKRFEPAGQGFIYRGASGCDAAIFVSMEERRGLEADLDQRIRRAGVLANGWLLAGAAIGPPVLLYSFGASGLIQWVVLLSVVATAVLWQVRCEGAVMRRLAGRPPVAPCLSRMDQILRDAERQSWFRILVLPMGSIASLFNFSKAHDGALTRLVCISLGVPAVAYGCVCLAAKIWLSFRRSRSA